MTKTYVIGHVNPDTDSIASAVGYAWLLGERDGEEVIAGRAGPLNPQTTWVLKRLELESPVLLTDASPRFEVVTTRLNTTAPDQPLSEAWTIASRTGGIAPVVDADGKPIGLITGLSLFAFLGKMMGPNPRRQMVKIDEILAAPSREACDIHVPKFPINARIRDVIHRILREEHNEFIIVDEAGLYEGVARQRDVLNPPRLRIVMVDHNEPRQAISSVEEAEIIEILDHHRLGNPSTHIPIRFTVDVVGSTSTLVSEKIEDAGLSAPPAVAGLLLAGLLSDTLVLTSPTTTPRDQTAAERLARWAFVRGGPLHGESIKSFGEKVIQAGAGIETRAPAEIVNSDMKTYEAGGFRFAVAQVEVTNLIQLDDNLAPLQRALRELRETRALDFAMLMVTDIVRSSSRLIIDNPPYVLQDLPFLKQPDGSLLAEGIVSRKKQLLPTVLGMLEN
jgi:manganese-dependent inorganic pyrophosphatase